MPAVVVTSAVGRWLRITDPQKYGSLPLAEIDDRWQGYQRELAVRLNGAQVIAHTADHAVHEDAPQLVALVVDAVVMAARAGGSVRLDPAALHDAGGGLVGYSAL